MSELDDKDKEAAAGEAGDGEKEEVYWTLTDWMHHFDLADDGEKLVVDRFYVWCPCKGHHSCAKWNTNAKASSIGSIWSEDDGPARILCHLKSSPKHGSDANKSQYTQEWCEQQVVDNPALVEKKVEHWTVLQLNTDPPPWVQCPRMSRKKGQQQQQDYESEQGWSSGWSQQSMGKGKGSGKKGKQKENAPRVPEPHRAPKRPASDMQGGQQPLQAAPPQQSQQSLALQSQALSVPVPHLVSMAAAGIGPTSSSRLLSTGIDGARQAPRSECVAT